jgi:hypothetical protein
VLTWKTVVLIAATILTVTLASAASGAEADGSASAPQSGAPVPTADLAPGWKVRGDSIIWGDGSVILHKSTTLGTEDCSYNYVCLWADANFGRPMIQFRDPGGYNLTSYGFNDKMSSWYNRKRVDARWYYDVNRGGTSRCMNAGAKMSYVGATDNDKMSALYIYTTSSACS